MHYVCICIIGYVFVLPPLVTYRVLPSIDFWIRVYLHVRCIYLHVFGILLSRSIPTNTNHIVYLVSGDTVEDVARTPVLTPPDPTNTPLFSSTPLSHPLLLVPHTPAPPQPTPHTPPTPPLPPPSKMLAVR